MWHFTLLGVYTLSSQHPTRDRSVADKHYTHFAVAFNLSDDSGVQRISSSVV